MVKYHKLYFDGASRGNPGMASLGGVIYNLEGEEMINFKKYIGKATNNVAEYSAVLAGLQVLIKYKIREVEIYGDSKFIESQAFAYLGIRRVKNLPISFPGTTGVKYPITGGKITKLSIF